MNNQFSLADIIQALHGLGISYKQVGECRASRFHFCSLRAPEPNGIYFYEAATLPAGDYSNSVFLANTPVSVPGTITLIVSHPQVAFYKLMNALVVPQEPAGYIHGTAIVDQDAIISETAYIGPYCVIGKATIGLGVRLHSHVVVMDGCFIEEDVVIESHSTIGATGVAWVWDPDTNRRVIQPQIGGVRIGKGSFIGSDVSVVRGSVNEVTTVGDECVIAHGSKIGHGCRIGREVHFANNVSVAGNVDIGKRSFLGAGCVIRPQIKLAPETTVAAGAVVVKDVVESGSLLMGVPADLIKKSGTLVGVPKNIKGEDKV